MTNQDVVTVLNDLIETCKDGEKGFNAAAKDINASDLQTILQECAQNCATSTQELQDKVRMLGGEPGNSGTVMGAVHRGWLDIKSAVAGRDDHSILEECERGEDAAVSRYADALDKELPYDVRALVYRQYEGVLRNHDKIRNLRDETATQA